ncbi:MAG: nucleoside 2-deoxyribosyltransferase [Dongiaceae bacterium]
MRRCYLAGPDVFHPQAAELAAGKRALCLRFGITGCFPLDNGVDLTALADRDAALAIYRANIDLMYSCDLLIANLTPFRGVSADPGTVFELGFMAALGRPVAGYSLDQRPYLDRVRLDGLAPGDSLHDEAGHEIENFGLAENLMIIGALDGRPDRLVLRPGHAMRIDDHLAAFEDCLRRVLDAA